MAAQTVVQNALSLLFAGVACFALVSLSIAIIMQIFNPSQRSIALANRRAERRAAQRQARAVERSTNATRTRGQAIAVATQHSPRTLATAQTRHGNDYQPTAAQPQAPASGAVTNIVNEAASEAGNEAASEAASEAAIVAPLLATRSVESSSQPQPALLPSITLNPGMAVTFWQPLPFESLPNSAPHSTIQAPTAIEPQPADLTPEPSVTTPPFWAASGLELLLKAGVLVFFGTTLGTWFHAQASYAVWSDRQQPEVSANANGSAPALTEATTDDLATFNPAVWQFAQELQHSLTTLDQLETPPPEPVRHSSLALAEHFQAQHASGPQAQQILTTPQPLLLNPAAPQPATQTATQQTLPAAPTVLIPQGSAYRGAVVPPATGGISAADALPPPPPLFESAVTPPAAPVSLGLAQTQQSQRNYVGFEAHPASYRLQGILEQAQGSVALFNIDGSIQYISPGQPIGISGWYLERIDRGRALVVSQDQTLMLDVGQALLALAQ